MNCLKCGRTVPDGILICPECLAAAKAPVRTEPEPLQEELQKQKIEKLTKCRRRLKRWLAALIVLCVLGLAVLAGAAYYMMKQHSRLTAQTSRINSLETALEEEHSNLTQAEAANDTLRQSIAEERELIEAYEAYTGLSPEEITALPPEPLGKP